MFLPRLATTEDQARTIVDVTTPLNTYVDAAVPEFVMGTRDPNSDADWDTYVKAIEGFGVDLLVSTYQDAYDAIR